MYHPYTARKLVAMFLLYGAPFCWTIPANATSYLINTAAGNGVSSFSGDGGPATAAGLANPMDIKKDASGNLYIADSNNDRIRKVNAAGIITTIAGNGTRGFSGDGGPATSASLNRPHSICLDGAGNIYFSDNGNNRIRKINTSGTIVTVAGDGNARYFGDGGPATQASFSSPSGLALDASGNVYIADFANYRIRKINTVGTISTFAGIGTYGGLSGDGGAATAAQLNAPTGLAFDATGNLYISEAGTPRVRKVDTSGIITTYAGNGGNGFSGDGGPAVLASFRRLGGLAFNSAGVLFLSDQYSHRIRVIDTNGVVNTLVGDGIARFAGDGGVSIVAEVSSPYGVATDSAGNVYIGDTSNNRVRILTPLSGSGTPPSIVTQPQNQTVLLGQTATFTVTASGTGPFTYQWQKNGAPITGATASSYTTPVTRTSDNGTVFAVLVNNDSGFVQSNNVTLTVTYVPIVFPTPQDETAMVGQSATFTVGATAVPSSITYQWFKSTNGGSTFSSIVGGTNASYLTPAATLNDDGTLFKVTVSNSIGSVTTNPVRWTTVNSNPTIITTMAGSGNYLFSGDGGPAVNAGIGSVNDVAVGPNGDIFIADSGNNRIRRVDGHGTITTFAGGGNSGVGDGGPATAAQIYTPMAIAFDASGNLYIADALQCRVRKVNASGIITTVAGNGTYAYSGDNGPATSASFMRPSDLAFDASGNLFIADVVANVVRKVGTNGIITTFAGNGSSGFSGDGGAAISARFNEPTGLAIDASGNVYISDFQNARIRKVDRSGIITTFTGNGTGFSGDGGRASSAGFYGPTKMTFDAQGNFYISTAGDKRIRRVDTSGIICTYVGNGLSGFSGDGGPATSASISNSQGLDFDSVGNLYFADRDNYRIRVVTRMTGISQTPPTIVTQPANQSANVGQTATFQITASGTPAPTYQWKLNGTNITNATSRTYTTPVTSVSNNGDIYTCVATNAAGTVTSNPAVLTVIAAPPPDSPPVIVTQPVGQSVNVGQTATFQITATGNPAPTYQWRLNATNINNATSRTYTTPATTSANDGNSYTCVVTNVAGTITSSPAILTVLADPMPDSPPVISGLFVDNITPTSAVVSWTTNVLADSQVEYGLTFNFGTLTPIESSLTTSHSVALSHLSPSTTYQLRVRSQNAQGNMSISSNQMFTTLTGSTPPPTPPQLPPSTGDTSGRHMINVREGKTASFPDEVTSITLYNRLGQKVASIGGANLRSYDGGNLPSGVYVGVSNLGTTFKIIIVR